MYLGDIHSLRRELLAKIEQLSGDLDTVRERLYDEIADRRAKELRPASTVLHTSEELSPLETRVREKLCYGMHPSIEDLQQLWHNLYGEDIRPRKRRCDECNGEGYQPHTY